MNARKANGASHSERRVDAQELTMAGWLDRLDPGYWVRSGRMGTGEARKASIEMMWRYGMERPEAALAYAERVCLDRGAAPMESRLAGVGVLAAWTAQGKALPWIGTDRAAGCNEGMAWEDPRMDCGVFDVILAACPEPGVKALGMAAFRALVAGREWQERAAELRDQGLAEPEEAEGMCREAAWARFDPERMRARLDGLAWGGLAETAPVGARFVAGARPPARDPLRAGLARRSAMKVAKTALAMRMAAFFGRR